MRKLLMTIGAAAITVGLALPLGAYAAVYSYANGSVSPNDGKVTILCDGGGAITNLTMGTDIADETVLMGDTLDFANGAVVKAVGSAVVSNAFTAAGAVVFAGVKNETVTTGTWEGDAYMDADYVTLFRNVRLDEIEPLYGYGRRGTDIDYSDLEAFRYNVFYVERDGDTMRFEMQRIHQQYTMGIFIELKQVGDDIVGRRLLAAYRNSDKYGQKMFKYENGTASLNSTGTTSTLYKAKILNIGPRYSSALTFAVSGTETLKAVSGGNIVVTFEGVGADAKVRATIANTMTNGAFAVKGDSLRPIEFEVAAKYALPPKIDCYGNAMLDFSVDGAYNDGVAKGTDAIYMHEGSTLSVTGAHPFHYASGTVVLDGATMTHTTTQNAYLNYLTLKNGATISLSSTGTFRGGFTADNPTWTVAGTGRSTYNGNPVVLAKATGTASSSYQYLTIDVGDTVAGDGTDFLVTGNIVNDSSYKMASFIKAGAGTMEIDGTIQTVNIPVRVAEGVLLLGRSGATAAGVDFSLEGGSLALAAGTANSADAFALTADSTLSFGDGAAISLVSLSIPDGATLTLAGNVPSRGLRVSSDPGEETLGRIVFADGRRGTVVWDSNGYVRANGKGLIISVY